MVEREHRSVVGDDVILERVLLKLSSNAATFCRLVIATEYIIARRSLVLIGVAVK